MDALQNFTEDSLPDLDIVTLGALELFSQTEVPHIDFKCFQRPLVVGSGNAAVTGRLLFSDVDAVFADESSYLAKLSTFSAIDGAFLISASGSKHAVGIAQELANRNIPTVLLTNNENAPAQAIVGADNTHVFPKNREPYTYNTSTYLGMVLSKTQGNAGNILEHIQTQVQPLVPQNLNTYDAYYLIVPERFTHMREMIVTKFNELFGPKVMGRVYTLEQTKHAKTVITSDNELFISFGEENTLFGKPENRITIPLPEGGCLAAMIAVSYYFVGQLQKQLPPYYKQRIGEYVKETSEMFGSTINVIVE